uniref:Large ribosomal subunit protein bL32c n=1 Tax=Eutreptiella eupharyngea TaxID=215702 RepID=A0A977PJB2_9EUGL|nr:ribosomal protein L32 [Eutreptiella eupharyngea]YP_010502756.1 ribosomal protein L32 [Eutreptiella eupharyngea]UXD06284.1 ribosomal protein L32 [Eutreptiella eupharyngea]UXD06352.1 ribosomal protein L32 [Eutreptiella eupharyngea]
MAVPKKKMSKSRKNMRKSVWKQKASKQATLALSLAKAVLSGNSKGFLYLSSDNLEK